MRRGQLELRPCTPLGGALFVDLFAGGGGTSSGVARAIGRDPDIAVNHDAAAIAMHKANHPTTRHYCESVYRVDPRKVCEGRRVWGLWASPDCTHHSKAKGGKPVKKKLRGLAWVVCRWAREVRPQIIFLENVEEFADWGPLGPDNRPDKTRKGKTFRAWVRKLESYGYHVEHRILVAADFGAPTTRKRLFVIARRDGQPIRWPEPTHGKGRSKPWRTAAEIINFSLPCRSIFERKRPLAEATLRRIAFGVMRYVVEARRPFVVPHDGGLAGATLIQTSYGERRGQAPRVPGLHKPIGTIVAGGVKHALVAALLTKHFGGVHPTGAPKAYGADLRNPLPTVTARDHNALTAVHLTKFQQNSTGQGLDEPLHTVMAGATRFGLVAAFLVKYYGTGTARPLTEPLGTVTTKDRFALVMVDGVPYAISDIRMRMLVARELFRGQGFDDDYVIDPLVDGEPITQEQQIEKAGNAVPPVWPEVLVRANLPARAARAA